MRLWIIEHSSTRVHYLHHPQFAPHRWLPCSRVRARLTALLESEAYLNNATPVILYSVAACSAPPRQAAPRCPSFFGYFVFLDTMFLLFALTCYALSCFSFFHFLFSRSGPLSSKLEELSKTLFPLRSLLTSRPLPETRSPPRVGRRAAKWLRPISHVWCGAARWPD